MSVMDLSAYATEYTFTPSGTGPVTPGTIPFSVRAVRRGAGKWAILHQGLAWTGNGWQPDQDGSGALLSDVVEATATAAALPDLVRANGLTYAESLTGVQKPPRPTREPHRPPAATIFDLTAAILAATGEIPTMKLHKLAFYAQAWHLAWEDELLVDAGFFAWGAGPVNPELHASHKGVFLLGESPGNANVFTAGELESIQAVVHAYATLKTHVLSGIVRNEDPWKEAWDGPGVKGRLIDIEAAGGYYLNLDGKPVDEVAEETL